MELREGQIIANHALVRKLGGGAFGEVWLVRHVDLGEERAMKIPTDPEYVRQLRMEGRIQFSLRHPNIVQTLDLNTNHSPPYFVMEYVEGMNLRQHLGAQAKLPLYEAMGILAQILDALAAAHAQNVIHRDIKPENVLLTSHGQVKVTDFGLGKVQAQVERSLLLSGSLVSKEGKSISGTTEYMSPEAKAGKDGDVRDDLYALGVMACEMLTGTRPSGLGIPKMFRRAGVDARATALVEKALEEPAYRYQSAAQMAAAVAALTRPQPAAGATPVRPPPLPPTPPPLVTPPVVPMAAPTPPIVIPSPLIVPVEPSRPRPSVAARIANLKKSVAAWSDRKWIAVIVGTAACLTLGVGIPLLALRASSKPADESRPAVEVRPPRVDPAAPRVGATPPRVSAPPPRIPVTPPRVDPPAPRDLTTLDCGNGVTMKLAKINAGTFAMGSPADEAGRSDDEAQHTVTLTRGFYIGVTEVTQEQYEAVMGNNPSRFKGARNPVENVSWNDAVEFCRKLSAKAGRTVRLPTEAQWEYACRAATAGQYEGGKLDDLAWYSANSSRQTHFTGVKQPNPWGLYDMHGNVWEWCYDAYNKDYPRGGIDPVAEGDAQELRVLRGGAWSNDPVNCRAAYRSGRGPASHYDDFGFRVCVDF